MGIKARRTIPAGRFKAQCLSLLDRVARTGEPLIVTKRGRPVAKVVPVDEQAAPTLVGSVVVKGDIVGPILDQWEVEG
jgi:prevent-host-death family protein